MSSERTKPCSLSPHCFTLFIELTEFKLATEKVSCTKPSLAFHIFQFCSFLLVSEKTLSLKRHKQQQKIMRITRRPTRAGVRVELWGYNPPVIAVPGKLSCLKKRSKGQLLTSNSSLQQSMGLSKVFKEALCATLVSNPYHLFKK